MQVYIANLGKYNEGELVGAWLWFAPPIDESEVAEHIGLNGEYEEYAIHDYELPFEIGEYCSIDEINRMCEAVESIQDENIRDNMQAIIDYFGFSGVEDLADKQDDISFLCGDSLEDLAYVLVEDGYFGEIPETISGYIDYAAIARDMEIDGYYMEINSGIIEYRG